MTRVVKNPSGYRSKGRNGAEKAQQFGLHCKEHDWSGKYHLDEATGIVYLFARRGESETIEIWWSEKGKALPDKLPVYTLAGERIKLRNVSAAAVKVASEPDTSRLTKATRKQRRQLGADAGPVVVQGSYDFSDMTDDEVEQALLGRRITWINSISGQADTAMVEGRKTLRVTRDSGDDTKAVKAQVHFTDTSGFHAVYLDNIVSVA